jgi:AcrR family transcriptional regulator
MHCRGRARRATTAPKKPIAKIGLRTVSLIAYRARGRPRSAASDRAILDAARVLLDEGPLGDLTMEKVAARAGVAKTTLYRRWRTKEQLALAVLGEMARRQVPVPDLGDTRAEFVHAVADTARTMDGTIAGRTIRGLVPALGTDRELAAAFVGTLVELRRTAMRSVVDRGLARGDLNPDAPLELVSDLLIGPLLWRLLLTGERLDVATAERLVDAALHGLAADPRPPAERS